jgi:hypothetical protein
MKKVIIEQNEQVIRLEDVRDSMIIGIEWGSGRKSFLIKNENKKTISISLGERDTIGCWSKSSHFDYVKEAISGSTAKNVFVFDSPKELAQWLAE